MSTNLATTRHAAPAPHVGQAFGTLPPARTRLDIDRALELAGVDAIELALLASTTFKEARSLEELVTLVATTRRRGLDGLLKQVYFERFGGPSSDPSLHVGIDGLRSIAARTGRYGGRLEPRFHGSWRMPLEDGKTKPVPEKCIVTVYAIVQGKSCAFEGVAYMDESYPGPSARGRMWRQRPRGMLAIAAERQALRSAFPAETSGIGDAPEYDDTAQPEPAALPGRSGERSAATYQRIYEAEDRWDQPTGDTVVNTAGHTVNTATGEILPVSGPSPSSPEPGEPLAQPPEQAAPDRQDALAEPEPISGKNNKQPLVTVRSALAQRFADLVEEAARLEVAFDDLKLQFPAEHEDVVRKGEKLRDRIEAKKAKLTDPSARESEPTQEALV